MSKRRETPDVLAAILEGRELVPMPRADALALVVPDEFTKEEWLAFGVKIRKANTWLRFTIGDWLLAGNHKWGDMYGEAERITGKSNQYLRDCAYVARAFDLSSRDDNLSWSHHKVIAGAEEEHRVELLDITVEKQLSVLATRALMQSSKSVPEPLTPDGAGEVGAVASTGVVDDSAGEAWGERRDFDGRSDNGGKALQAAQTGPGSAVEGHSAVSGEASKRDLAPARLGIAGPAAGALPADLVACGWELCTMAGDGVYGVRKSERPTRTTPIFRDSEEVTAFDRVVRAIGEIEERQGDDTVVHAPGFEFSTVLVELKSVTANVLVAWLVNHETDGLPGLPATEIGEIRAACMDALRDTSTWLSTSTSTTPFGKAQG